MRVVSSLRPWVGAALAGCSPAAPGPTADAPVDIATPDDGWLRGDLHFHTNYSDDALDQAGDWMRPALAIADAWRAPAWVEANPTRPPTDHLQFIAVTDHRTVAGLSDPDFVHDYLVLLRGEEFGSDGHAGIWGLTEHVPHEPQGGETAAARVPDAVAAAHAQGALFSINHPTYAGDLWTWEVAGVDAVEVWNGPWSLLPGETDEATLDTWIAEKGGSENAVIRTAIRAHGGGQNAQALRFWQAMLSLGHHAAPVGGGDRHVIFPAGLPTTYVQAPTRDEAGVLAGIASGATFVSRSPHGPQVRLEAEVEGVRYAMGAALPSGAASVTVRWHVGRAAGGTLTLVSGRVDPTLPEPEVATTVVLRSDDEEGAWTWTPPDGAWLHAIVTDPLPPSDDPALQALADQLLHPRPGGDVGGLFVALGSLVELAELSEPEDCDPASWSPTRFQCMPADEVLMGSFYVPVSIQPWLSLVTRDGAPTGEAMGAVSAAFFVPPVVR